jgi:hypothetical protein
MVDNEMDDYTDIPIPEQYDEKEVYAFFGLAAYTAQVLERGVIILSVVMRIGSIPKVTRNLIDELYANFEAKTFGRLLKYARNSNVIQGDLFDDLDNALQLRNKLIHRFFYENAENFMSIQGRKIMIDELRSMSNIFEKIDQKLEPISLSLWEKYGVTKEYIDKEYEQLIIRAKDKYGAI